MPRIPWPVAPMLLSATHKSGPKVALF